MLRVLAVLLAMTLGGCRINFELRTCDDAGQCSVVEPDARSASDPDSSGAPRLGCGSPDVILCLPFDGDVLDRSGSGVATSMPAGSTFTPGFLDRAIALTNEGIIISEANDPDPTTATLEVFASWSPDGAYRTFFETAGMRLMYLPPDTLHCQIAVVGGNATAVSNTFGFDTAFHHVACVWTGTTMSIYYDGQLANTNTTPSVSGALAGVTDTGVGTETTQTRTFTGKLDQLQLWNRGLSAEEVCTQAGWLCN